MKGELTKTDVNGCTSLQDILKAMNLDEDENDILLATKDEPEYDIVLVTEDERSFNDEEEEAIAGIKFMPTSHLNY